MIGVMCLCGVCVFVWCLCVCCVCMRMDEGGGVEIIYVCECVMKLEKDNLEVCEFKFNNPQLICIQC